MTAAGETEQVVSRPRMDRSKLVFRYGVTLVIIIGAVWSFTSLDISVERLRTAPGDIWGILRLTVPPDMEGDFVSRVFGKVLESVYIAWVGTMIAALISLPLAFMGAENTAPRWLQLPIRQLFNVIRSFPELILAVLLLPITGLGAWTGTLAIGLHSVGTLGKLSTEAIESIDSGPAEAAQAAGGNRIEAIRWGVLPQVLPTIVAYWLFRFEINVRASAVMGVIGAGGVGSELINQLNFRQFDKAGTVLLFTILVVLFIDTSSAAVRRRIILGGGTSESANTEVFKDLSGLTGPGLT